MPLAPLTETNQSQGAGVDEGPSYSRMKNFIVCTMDDISLPSSPNFKEARKATGRREAAPAEKAQKASGPPRLNSLDGSRFIAAAVIVAYHFYEKDAGGIAHWGSCWVQYFFALSGFVLAYSELTKPKEAAQRQTQMQYLHRRLSSTYPVYVFALLSLVFEAGHEHHTDYEWSCLPYQFSMMQGWFASCSHWQYEVLNYQCCSQTWNSVSWYMSVLVPFWLLARPLSEAFRNRSAQFCCLSMVLLWLWSFVPYWIGLWNAKYQHGKIWISTFDALAFNPIGYLHVFACGVPAARLFILLGIEDAETGSAPDDCTTQFRLKQHGVPFIFKCGACIGYSCLLLIFIYVSYDERWLFYHSGGLLPFMVLILWSLSLAQDPIAYVFGREPFSTLGRISYAMYILQFRVWWFVYHFEGEAPKKTFPFYLLAVSYLVHHFIEAPYIEWQSLRRERQEVGFDDQVVDVLDSIIHFAWRNLQGLYACFASRCTSNSDVAIEEDLEDTDLEDSSAPSVNTASGN